MTAVPLTPELEAEYEQKLLRCVVNPARGWEVTRMVSRMLASILRYEVVVGGSPIPWYYVAVVHYMECGLSFARHLHNGDPLTAKTTHVPVGRPVFGRPPFQWEVSARDAIVYQGWDRMTHWSVGAALYRLEAYNGWGYRLYHPSVSTPYLWGGTSEYTRGKYTSDGHFDADAVSQQLGAAALLRGFVSKGVLALPGGAPGAA